jgi:hypothetical protein
MKKEIYIFIFLFCFAGLAVAGDMPVMDTVTSAPGITIETAVDRAEIYIGDLIKYRLTIIHDSNIILTPPPIGANLGAFDVKDYQTDETAKLEDGRIKIESRFTLTTFTTGDYIIPPIPIKFMLRDSTVKYLVSEPTPIKVKSLLAESADTADIRDIKGPIDFKAGRELYYYLGAGLLVAIGIASYLYWKYGKSKMQISEPVDLRKPWEIAFEALAILKEKNYPTDGQTKQFYIELTEIIRAYLGRIYVIPALDMTTEEFLGCIIEKDISEELYGRLKLFLNYSDLVKFAKLTPEAMKINSDFEEAVTIVETIRQTEMTKIAKPMAEFSRSNNGRQNV